MLRDISKILSKIKIKPELQAIHFKNGMLEATDSYKLIRMKHDFEEWKDKEAMIFLDKFPAQIKDITSDVVIDNKAAEYRFKKLEGHYPDVDEVFPKDEPVFTIKLSSKKLSDLLDFISKNEKKEDVIFEFYGDKKLVKLTSEKIEALIMPS